MPYAEAIEYLKAHDIRKDDGTFYEFGEVCEVLLFSILYVAHNNGYSVVTQSQKRMNPK